MRGWHLALFAVVLAVIVDPVYVGASGPVRDSVSCGSVNRGALARAARLPTRGVGYIIPEPWRSRGLHYGTDELVGLIRRAAARVAGAHPGAILGVADLAHARGGRALRHLSHQSGRDADLHFYALDQHGEPFVPDAAFPNYRDSGMATSTTYGRRISARYFDLPRNWALIAALLTDDDAIVTHIFISTRIERWLLAYGQAIGAPPELLAHASAVMREPSDSSPHNDHLHLRIACTIDDFALGSCLPGIFVARGPIICPATRPRIVLPD